MVQVRIHVSMYTCTLSSHCELSLSAQLVRRKHLKMLAGGPPNEQATGSMWHPRRSKQWCHEAPCYVHSNMSCWLGGLGVPNAEHTSASGGQPSKHGAVAQPLLRSRSNYPTGDRDRPCVAGQYISTLYMEIGRLYAAGPGSVSVLVHDDATQGKVPHRTVCG